MNSLRANRALKAMGSQLKTARRKRRISIDDFAERMGVSRGTVIRLEKGEAGVSIGTLTMACLVLGELDRISLFLDAASDETGLFMAQEQLPKRIDGNRKNKSSKKNDDSKSLEHNREGVGF